MALIAEYAYASAGNFEQNSKAIGVISDQQLVDEDRNLSHCLAMGAINRALKQSRTGRDFINRDISVWSLLGMYTEVGESATYVDKTNGIGFSAAVEEKNELALRGPGEIFTLSDADKLLAESSALSRGVNRRSTTSSRAAAPGGARSGGFSP